MVSICVSKHMQTQKTYSKNGIKDKEIIIHVYRELTMTGACRIGSCYGLVDESVGREYKVLGHYCTLL